MSGVGILILYHNKEQKSSLTNFCPPFIQFCPILSNSVQFCPILSNSVQIQQKTRKPLVWLTLQDILSKFVHFRPILTTRGQKTRKPLILLAFWDILSTVWSNRGQTRFTSKMALHRALWGFFLQFCPFVQIFEYLVWIYFKKFFWKLFLKYWTK